MEKWSILFIINEFTIYWNVMHGKEVVLSVSWISDFIILLRRWNDF